MLSFHFFYDDAFYLFLQKQKIGIFLPASLSRRVWFAPLKNFATASIPRGISVLGVACALLSTTSAESVNSKVLAISALGARNCCTQTQACVSGLPESPNHTAPHPNPFGEQYNHLELSTVPRSARSARLPRAQALQSTARTESGS
jgi:hypothetical protein